MGEKLPPVSKRAHTHKKIVFFPWRVLNVLKNGAQALKLLTERLGIFSKCLCYAALMGPIPGARTAVDSYSPALFGSQPHSQSSSAIADVTSPVKLIGRLFGSY